ncbi:hypothetical protein PSHT_13579 [Puccinia striiformis]|uniref:Protein BTN n=1 Tax=Puccinia striiformis TaxID=27350 RepID=A0A2S4UQ09_9BASI|nr:hypothetical protein PSHT_13579 [Puccinia striiformis]
MVEKNFNFCLSLFLFGLLNNVLYVIIISAALDLVPSDVPTGVILIADITPSLIVKIGWPYFVKGKIQYSRRILSCSVLSFAGMMVIVIFSSVPLRLFGISLASLSSGLGEMTFLQLTTRYPSQSGVSWFASGTGAAGVVGAGLWWLLRHLDLADMSLIHLLLSVAFSKSSPRPERRRSRERGEYEVVSQTDQSVNESITTTTTIVPVHKQLSFKDKIRLAKPLLMPYMLPLFAVYFAEYTINTGIAPTLLYPPPTKNHAHSIFSLIFKSLRDYYPFWQLTYQIINGNLPISSATTTSDPTTKYDSSADIQCIINGRIVEFPEWNRPQRLDLFLILPSFQSKVSVVVSLMLSVYYWLGNDHATTSPIENEFRIACVGFADTFGIYWLQSLVLGLNLNYVEFKSLMVEHFVEKITKHQKDDQYEHRINEDTKHYRWRDAFFRAIIRYRPRGPNRHFSMVGICKDLERELNTVIPSEEIWSTLRSCYDLDMFAEMEPDELDDIDRITYPSYHTDRAIVQMLVDDRRLESSSARSSPERRSPGISSPRRRTTTNSSKLHTSSSSKYLNPSSAKSTADQRHSDHSEGMESDLTEQEDYEDEDEDDDDDDKEFEEEEEEEPAPEPRAKKSKTSTKQSTTESHPQTSRSRNTGNSNKATSTTTNNTTSRSGSNPPSTRGSRRGRWKK